MNKILVLSCAPSDLSDLILSNCRGAVALPLARAKTINLDGFGALAILGGNSAEGLLLPAVLRCEIERFRESGKPVFFEFVRSCGTGYSEKAERVTHHRLVYRAGASERIEGLSDGDILDGHENDLLTYWFRSHEIEPTLRYFPYVSAHDRIGMDGETYQKGVRALWRDKNELIAAFRLCNFRRARLAPRKNWEAVIAHIVSFLAGERVTPRFLPPVCGHLQNVRVSDPRDVAAAVQKGLAWFERADILLDNGKAGAAEGLAHHVSAMDGTQTRAPLVRTDCSGEVGGAYLLDWLLNGHEKSRKRFEDLEDFCFGPMQVKEGKFAGMLRWSEIAWMCCYQDDAARAMLPTLILQNFGGGEKSRHFGDAVAALRFLVDTTDPRGLRVSRTDIIKLTDEKWKELRTTESGTPCAHYNAYYHAALILCARAGGPKEFLTVAERGLSAIMALYPDTVRETSETEELCRLVFPLAALYESTGKEEHKAWLYRVVQDLARLRHKAGGYAEWDTGYKAKCARRENGECALLANNGDPVADLLYSNNWLPLGFAFAYFATGDELFFEKWKDIAAFLLTAQIASDRPELDGAWARAFDMERREIYGVPHDVGWSPCCVESGWTVAEILIGLQFMQLIRK